MNRKRFHYFSDIPRECERDLYKVYAIRPRFSVSQGTAKNEHFTEKIVTSRIARSRFSCILFYTKAKLWNSTEIFVVIPREACAKGLISLGGCIDSRVEKLLGFLRQYLRDCLRERKSLPARQHWCSRWDIWEEHCRHVERCDHTAAGVKIIAHCHQLQRSFHL